MTTHEKKSPAEVGKLLCDSICDYWCIETTLPEEADLFVGTLEGFVKEMERQTHFTDAKAKDAEWLTSAVMVCRRSLKHFVKRAKRRRPQSTDT